MAIALARIDGAGRNASPASGTTPWSYAYAVKRACEAAFGMPHELKDRPGQDNSPEAVAKRRDGRKAWRTANMASEPVETRPRNGVVKAHGLEVAAAVLRHAKVETTQIYAERNMQTAREVAAAIG